MNGIMNENQLTIAKEYDFNKPDIHEIEYLLDDIMKDSRNKYFTYTLEYRLVHDIIFTNISNDEEVNFTITRRSMEFKTEFYGLNKRIKNARINGLTFNQINKLIIKIYSSLPNRNIHNYLKF